MDVQPAPAVESLTGAVTTQPAPTPQTNAVPSVQDAVPSTQATSDSDHSQSGIAPAVAKLFGGALPQPSDLSVSYRVEDNDMVTIFTDPNTGQEVAQFPSAVLLGLAQFFDQQSGVTFDKNA